MGIHWNPLCEANPTSNHKRRFGAVNKNYLELSSQPYLELCSFVSYNKTLYTCLTIITIWANSADDKWLYFSYFHKKQISTFHANCPLWKQFVQDVKTCFLGKIIFFELVITKKVKYFYFPP